ncbi:MAG: cupin domain-containing protein [Puniceicoccaceae bacterium]|nr:MAG: cupin domain-containing protein [Puniceicoccaceae bacterium]
MNETKQPNTSSKATAAGVPRSVLEAFPAGPGGSGGPVVRPAETGARYDLGGLGVHWRIDGGESGGRFSIVHHPMAPRALAAPLHRHHREDEYSYVLTGTLGALLGDHVVTAGPGSWVFKPRGEWHTFWNAGDTPCEIIEVISPGGFENYFREVAAAWGDLEKFAELNRRYELEMDFGSVPGLCERFGLTFPQL